MRYNTEVRHVQMKETFPMQSFGMQEEAQQYIYQQSVACVASENGHMETSADKNTIHRYSRKKELISIFRVMEQAEQEAHA